MCSVFLEFGTVKFHLSIQDFYFLNRRIVVQPLSSLLLSFTFHWNLFSFFWFFFSSGSGQCALFFLNWVRMDFSLYSRFLLQQFPLSGVFLGGFFVLLGSFSSGSGECALFFWNWVSMDGFCFLFTIATRMSFAFWVWF
jgi:hypothetical protein